ncbi:MAG TPA: lytic transglycosylase domain-containing protein [Blastocatellia bacterium]|nr:lytic transglycosylase domain-containing protein [Blastocatellia bacterium]
MRTSLAVAITALILSTAAGAHAQESDQPLNADSTAAAVRQQSPHTPAMVVHEITAPPQSQQNLLPTPRVPAASSATSGATKSGPAMPPASPPAMVVPPARTFGQSGAFDIESTGNAKYDELIMKSSARHGVDPNLIVSMMRQESGFNPSARSYKGAAGLMQLMPATARRFGVGNVYDPAQNIEGGTKYLRFLLDTFDGDVELALAGYNAGENAVISSGFKVPRYRETRNYVKNISARYGSTKHRSAGTRAANGQAAAPAPITLSKGGSRGLTNNY